MEGSLVGDERGTDRSRWSLSALNLVECDVEICYGSQLIQFQPMGIPVRARASTCGHTSPPMTLEQALASTSYH